MAEDFFSAYLKGETANTIVPLAMQAMKLKMEQEQFEMVKNEKLKQIKGEEDFRKYVEEKSKPMTEQVTQPDIAPTTFQSQSFSNLPPMQLSSGLSGLTTTVEKPAPPLNPDELLKKAVQFGIMPADKYVTLLQGKDDIINIPAGGTAFSKSKNAPVFTAPKPLPEVNVANEIETILAGRFPKFYTDENARKDAYDYYAKHPQEVRAEAAEFAKSKAPPQFVYLQTDKGFVPAPVKGTGAGVIPDGLKPKPMESDIALQRNYDAADAIISELENKFKSAESSLPQDWEDRITGFPKRTIGIYAQTDPKLASVKALIQASESKMIRALGEVGTLTDRDVARAEAAMPTTNDTKSVRAEKFTQLRGLLREIYDRGKRYDTTKINMEPNAPNSPRPEYTYDVPKGVSKWTVPGEKDPYYIPQEKSAAFLKSHPKAQMEK